MIEFKKIGEGDIVESFTMFDPQVNDENELPTEYGTYMILTKSIDAVNSKLTEGNRLDANTISVHGVRYYVVYVGQTQGCGLRDRYKHHFTEKRSEHSTFRRKLGRRMGFELTGRTFLSKEEELTRFIRENFLFYYFVNTTVERWLIEEYKPPVGDYKKQDGDSRQADEVRMALLKLVKEGD